MDKKSKQGLWGCLTILLIIMAIGAAAGIANTNREKQIRDLIANVEIYGAVKGEYSAQAAKSPMKAFAVQNLDKAGSNGELYEYAPLYFDLDDAIRAKTPDEMNTLIQLYRHTDATGKYTSGKTAYTRYIELTAIDMESGKVIAAETFSGAPPFTLVGNQSNYGDWPTTEAVDFIQKLAGGHIQTPVPTSTY